MIDIAILRNNPELVKENIKKDEKGKDIIDEDKQQIINAQNIIYRLFEPSPNNKLEAISLRGNYLGNKIISHIFDLLKNNTTLRVLNIYKNNLTSECANSFCQMVLFHPPNPFYIYNNHI